MMKKFAFRDKLLAGICVFLIAAVCLLEITAVEGPDRLYDVKMEAYQNMSAYMEAIRGYRAELNIPIDLSLDIHNTGIIGREYTDITTSLAPLEAKRTAANPDLAAVVVELLSQAGIGAGDRVAANFSGSFPGLSLAVLAACAAMDVDIVYIMSVGASNFGGNLPELTFPDMAARLYADGLLPSPAAAFSMGGGGDVGNGIDPALLKTISDRLSAFGIPFIDEPDFNANLVQRMALFEEGGQLSGFISTGGNVTSQGRGERSYYIGEGLVTQIDMSITEQSGLMELYSAKGLPIINMLNMRKLTATHGLAFDPMVWPEPGKSAIFRQRNVFLPAALFCLICVIIVFIWMKRKNIRWP